MTDERDGTVAEQHDTGEAADPWSPTGQPISWYRTSTNSLVVASRDAFSVALALVVVGLVLAAISGLWPPVAVVESDSMVPALQEGDLVFLVEPDRYAGDGADDAGLVTRATGESTGYERFGAPGDVVVYRPNGRADRTPIIHRTELHVHEGERWHDRAAPTWLGDARSCGGAPDAVCPAPHAGYVTKGDANARYDQTVDGGAGSVTTVRPEWIRGKAVLRLRVGDCPSRLSRAFPNCLLRIAR
jgi:signal peptidase